MALRRDIEKAIEVRIGHKINFNDKEELALANIETFVFPSREENYL